MNTADFTMISKVAVGLAVAGFLVSFTTLNTSNSNGVLTCDFMDYGKVVLGGLAVVVGGLGEFSALRLGATRMPNLIASGGASAVGVFHLLVGFGVIGGPC